MQNGNTAESIRTGLISDLKTFMVYCGKGDERGPVRCTSNPNASPMFDSYLSFVPEEQKQVGVPIHHALPLLSDTLLDLFSDMRSRAQLGETLAERISLT